MARRHYTEHDKAVALAALEANGGNVSATVRETGVPSATLRLWRDAPERAAPAEKRSRARGELRDLFKSVAEKATELLDDTLDGLMPEAVAQNPKMLAALSSVAATATDKYRRLAVEGEALDELRKRAAEAGVTEQDIMAEVERILAGGE